jgi:hypothetical protein
MRRNQINTVASLITEDPDIFMELDAPMDASIEAPEAPGAEKPLDAVEIEKEADAIAGADSGDADKEIAGELQAQQEAEQQAEQERQKLLQPQIDEITGLADVIGTGITQGQAQASGAGDAFSGLDKEMAALKTVIANIGKTML